MDACEIVLRSKYVQYLYWLHTLSYWKCVYETDFCGIYFEVNYIFLCVLKRIDDTEILFKNISFETKLFFLLNVFEKQT